MRSHIRLFRRANDPLGSTSRRFVSRNRPFGDGHHIGRAMMVRRTARRLCSRTLWARSHSPRLFGTPRYVWGLESRPHRYAGKGLLFICYNDPGRRAWWRGRSIACGWDPDVAIARPEGRSRPSRSPRRRAWTPFRPAKTGVNAL